AGCPCVFIRGNNDFNFSLDREKVLELCGHRIYLTHGHNQRVYAGYDRLIRAAKEKDCTIAMFGHTHVPVNRAISGILLINPGSIARPRQADGLPTCMLIDVFDGKEPQIELISFKR
ncbi:MAG: YfcE family phosphodiesterase, partial [Lachnospiraceae bacterium]|nr:YfcE family phosphodiesterase [Lachnospiraceae bacterium]